MKTATKMFMFEFKGVTYTANPDWKSDLDQYGYTIVDGMKPRTDMFGPGTHRRQRTQLALCANGELDLYGYVVGKIEMPTDPPQPQPR